MWNRRTRIMREFTFLYLRAGKGATFHTATYRASLKTGSCNSDLSQTFVELSENARLVEHLSLVAVFIVVGDALAKTAR